MTKFGAMLCMIAMKKSIAQSAIVAYHSTNFALDSDTSIMQFINGQSSLPAKLVACEPLGIGFLDLYGASHIKVYATEPHPYPNEVHTQSNIYFRKTRTQGHMWFIMADELGAPLPFHDERAAMSVANFLKDYQPLWQSKYHSEITEPVDPPDESLVVEPGRSLEKLLETMRNAPR